MTEGLGPREDDMTETTTILQKAERLFESLVHNWEAWVFGLGILLVAALAALAMHALLFLVLRRMMARTKTAADDVLDWIDHGNGNVSPRYWTLDPIDGTKGFLRGEQYAVALALIEDGGVILGVLGCPNLPLANMSDTSRAGCIMYACRGGGAKLNSDAIRCSDPATKDQALIATGFPFRELSRLDRYLRAFEACVRWRGDDRRRACGFVADLDGHRAPEECHRFTDHHQRHRDA